MILIEAFPGGDRGAMAMLPCKPLENGAANLRPLGKHSYPLMVLNRHASQQR